MFERCLSCQLRGSATHGARYLFERTIFGIWIPDHSYFDTRRFLNHFLWVSLYPEYHAEETLPSIPSLFAEDDHIHLEFDRYFDDRFLYKEPISNNVVCVDLPHCRFNRGSELFPTDTTVL